MMKQPIQNRVGIALLVTAGLCSAASVAGAAPQIAALEGIQRLSERHGAHHVQKIVEMKGFSGQSQPLEWVLIAYDPSSESQLRGFRIDGARVINEGMNHDYYPNRQPAGFIDLQKWKLDSVAAFEILDREAERAEVGFNSIDYHLRCREFSDEPIWTLTARDPGGLPVARLDLSAQTGRVLRSVWTYREGRKVPIIKDSALIGQPGSLELELQEDEPLRPTRDDLPVGPAVRKEPLVPAPLDPARGLPDDPGTEQPEVRPIDPADPAPVPVPDEP